MSKKELVSQLTALVEGYTEGLRSANNKLLNSIQRERVEKQEWAQKYHMVMTDNKGLEEQNGILQEKAASLATLNETLATESQNWQGQCAELQGQYGLVLKELDTSKQIAEHWKTESLRISVKKTEVDEEREKADQLAERRFKECEALKKELAETKRELQTTQKNCDRKHEALKTMEVSWSKAFAAAEERHEDFKKRSDGILATMGENLQKKQEQIEALTAWKEGTEEVLNSMEEELKDYETARKVYEETIELLGTQKGELYSQLESLKQINSFQEHRIEVLARKANKLRKKEQND